MDRGFPSVNLVVLSFVQPLKLLNKTNDSQTANGVPIGMNSAIVSYFTSHNIRVMLSIGGPDLHHVLGPGAIAERYAVGLGMRRRWRRVWAWVLRLTTRTARVRTLPGCRPLLMHIARSCRTTPRERIPRRG